MINAILTVVACIACRIGKPNSCVQMKVLGVRVDGKVVEYITKFTCFLLHRNILSYDEIALVEPLAIGTHGVCWNTLQVNISLQ